MNYWFWIYIFCIPVLVFSATPQTNKYWRIGRLLAAIALCYLFINLAVHLKWDLLNKAVNNIPNPTREDFERATADGANIIFTLLLGWIPATTYVGWWELVWQLIYRKPLNLYKIRTRLSSVIIGFSLLISIGVFFYSIPLKYPYNARVFFQILLPPSLDAVGM